MWMLLEVILLLLIVTTALFIHEMGHAIAGVLRNKKAKAEIYLVSLTKVQKLKLRFGRITVILTFPLECDGNHNLTSLTAEEGEMIC